MSAGKGKRRRRRRQRQAGLSPPGQPRQPVFPVWLQPVCGGPSHGGDPRHGLGGPGAQLRLSVPRDRRWRRKSEVLHVYCARQRQRGGCQRRKATVQSTWAMFLVYYCSDLTNYYFHSFWICCTTVTVITCCTTNRNLQQICSVWTDWR